MAKVQVRHSCRPGLDGIGIEIACNAVHVRTSLAQLGLGDRASSSLNFLGPKNHDVCRS
jgi:hypothetical protein